MDSSELILSHFPDLNALQIAQFGRLRDIYTHWNNQINVISRKDFDSFYERHVLHSLGIAKVIQFLPNTSILDVGCGGGFPGIPLAILFPETNFLLVDSIGKKIKVVNEVATFLELTNVTGQHERAENVVGNFDFVVSRAVTRMNAFVPWVEKKIIKKSKHTLKNGILYLKGGDLTAELSEIKQATTCYNLSDFFEGKFFETKQVVHVVL